MRYQEKVFYCTVRTLKTQNLARKINLSPELWLVSAIWKWLRYYPSNGLQELNKPTMEELMSTGIYIHINTKHGNINIIILGMSLLIV